MYLYHNLLGFLLICVDECQSQEIMTEIHAGVCGGNLYWKTTANKILRARYYWPTLFTDVFVKVRGCVECQKLLPLPLIPISVDVPFQQWGLDFIGEIHPPSSG